MGGLLPLHPSCYYLYGIAKHASGNQHEIVNCSAHLCAAQGTGAFRRFASSEQGLSDQLPAHVVSLLTQNTVQQAFCLFFSHCMVHRGAVAIIRGPVCIVYLKNDYS